MHGGGAFRSAMSDGVCSVVCRGRGDRSAGVVHAERSSQCTQATSSGWDGFHQSLLQHHYLEEGRWTAALHGFPNNPLDRKPISDPSLCRGRQQPTLFALSVSPLPSTHLTQKPPPCRSCLWGVLFRFSLFGRRLQGGREAQVWGDEGPHRASVRPPWGQQVPQGTPMHKLLQYMYTFSDLVEAELLAVVAVTSFLRFFVGGGFVFLTTETIGLYFFSRGKRDRVCLWRRSQLPTNHSPPP